LLIRHLLHRSRNYSRVGRVGTRRFVFIALSLLSNFFSDQEDNHQSKSQRSNIPVNCPFYIPAISRSINHQVWLRGSTIPGLAYIQELPEAFFDTQYLSTRPLQKVPARARFVMGELLASRDAQEICGCEHMPRHVLVTVDLSTQHWEFAATILSILGTNRSSVRVKEQRGYM